MSKVKSSAEHYIFMIQKEVAYNEIAKLVERFGEQYDTYKKANNNETLTNRDFIDPLFKALIEGK